MDFVGMCIFMYKVYVCDKEVLINMAIIDKTLWRHLKMVCDISI